MKIGIAAMGFTSALLSSVSGQAAPPETAVADPVASTKGATPSEETASNGKAVAAEGVASEEEASTEEVAPPPAAEVKEPAAEQAVAAPAVAAEVDAGESNNKEVKLDSKPSSRNPGFYLRLTAGAGHAWGLADATGDQSELEINSWTANIMVSVGRMIAAGFAFHADYFAGFGMTYNSESNDDSEAYEAEREKLSMHTLGAGVTYHFMPFDLYVSGGGGLTFARSTYWYKEVDENGDTQTLSDNASVNPGLAAHGSVGKMFAVSPDWALGGSINYNFLSFDEREGSYLELDHVHSLWLGFTATLQP